MLVPQEGKTGFFLFFLPCVFRLGSRHWEILDSKLRTHDESSVRSEPWDCWLIFLLTAAIPRSTTMNEGALLTSPVFAGKKKKTNPKSKSGSSFCFMQNRSKPKALLALEMQRVTLMISYTLFLVVIPHLPIFPVLYLLAEAFLSLTDIYLLIEIQCFFSCQSCEIEPAERPLHWWTDSENGLHRYHIILLSYKEKLNYGISN